MTIRSHTQLGFGTIMLSPVGTSKFSISAAGKSLVPVSTYVLDRAEVLTPHLPALMFSPGWCLFLCWSSAYCIGNVADE